MDKEIKKVKFGVIVGNPPYMVTTGGGGKAKNQAMPIYQYFVDLAISAEPRFISMIMPSKWFAGGMTELTKFRSMMMNDSHLCTLIDYSNSKNCFPDVSIGGGVCYFLRDSTYTGLCQVTNIINGNAVIAQRQLNDFAVLVRYNEAVEILHKVCQDDFIPLATIVSPLCPFGFTTDARGRTKKSETNNLTLYSSQGKTYVSRQEVKNGLELIDKYKVMLGKMASEHAGEPSKADGKYRVFTNSMKVLLPQEVCTHSYFCCGCFESQTEAENLYIYLTSCFVRFLVLLSLTATNLSQKNFIFVPNQDFSDNSDIDWRQDIDNQLYKKYKLPREEIAFIESKIKSF